MEMAQLKELVLQALEVERGGVKIYTEAVECAENEDLRGEWEKYLEQTKNHVKVVERLCETLGIDAGEETPGVKVVRSLGEALLGAIQQARQGGDSKAAQIVAAEVITLAETKDHLDWELIGQCAAEMKGDKKKALKEAYDEVEDQEDEHLYHTRGWCRELWLGALGLDSMLPPPEERRHVKTEIGAARAAQSRKH